MWAMRCPHCLESFHDESYVVEILYRNARLVEKVPNQQNQTNWQAITRVCPACGRAIIFLLAHRWHLLRGNYTEEIQVWPKGMARAPLPKEVTDPFAADYREACNVLADSPKASAALSRRCLQMLLREKAGVKKTELYNEIEEVIKSGTLPSDLADALHHVRVIGNFAAHPEKSTSTGDIVDVEPGEAEWNLDVLDSLFDFYFVRPARLAERKAALNKKLGEAGKQPLK